MSAQKIDWELPDNIEEATIQKIMIRTCLVSDFEKIVHHLWFTIPFHSTIDVRFLDRLSLLIEHRKHMDTQHPWNTLVTPKLQELLNISRDIELFTHNIRTIEEHHVITFEFAIHFLLHTIPELENSWIRAYSSTIRTTPLPLPMF